MTDSTVEGTIEDGIYLVIKGHKFKCRKVSTTWQMMRFADAQKRAKSVHVPEHLPKDDPRRKEAEEKRNDAGLDSMVAMRGIVLKLLSPTERDRFDTFMDDEDIMPGELEEAVGDVIAEVGGQDEDKGKAQASHSPSSPSPTTTNANFQGGSPMQDTGMVARIE